MTLMQPSISPAPLLATTAGAQQGRIIVSYIKLFFNRPFDRQPPLSGYRTRSFAFAQKKTAVLDVSRAHYTSPRECLAS